MSRQYYLGKAGQSFGPYSEQEFEKLRQSEEFKDYGCLWDSSQPGWQILHCPPAPYTVADQKPVAAQQPQLPAHAPAPTIPSRVIANKSAVEAVCHDHRNLVSGELVSISDYGCELWASHGAKDRHFSDEAYLILNVLEAKSGRTLDIPAQLIQVSRKGGRWVYQLRWNYCPELVKKNAVAAA